MEPYPDRYSPQIQLISPSNNSVIQPGTILDFMVSDSHLDNVSYSLDDGIMQPFLPLYNITTDSWPDGIHKVKIEARDTFNNYAIKTYFFTIDSISPEIFLNSPGNNSVIQGGTVLDISIMDSNLFNVNYSINGGADTFLADPFDISTVGWLDDSYVVDINALDKAGLSNSSCYEFTVDSTPPIITLNDPENNDIFPAGEILNFTVSDPYLKDVNFSINDGNVEPFFEPYDISTLGWEDNDYFIQINASDLAGNLRSSLFEFTVDSTPPTITIDSSLNHSTVSSNEEIFINISDLHLVSAFYSLNGGPYVNYNAPYNLYTKYLHEDYYNITVRAIDAAENEAVIWFDIYIDQKTDYTPPEVISTIPSNRSNEVKTNTTMIITFSEPMSQINIEFYISCTPHVEFDLEWDVTKTILYISFENSNLKKATTYTLRIDSQIEDVNGNSMESDFILIFTTESPPELDSDNDGIPNISDPDDDNDGFLDSEDPYPLDPNLPKICSKKTPEDPTWFWLLILCLIIAIIVAILIVYRKKSKGSEESIEGEVASEGGNNKSKQIPPPPKEMPLPPPPPKKEEILPPPP
jgi:hypothetical protein